MNIIGMVYNKRRARQPHVDYWKYGGHWQVRYCVPAAPQDPPIACDGHVLEVWTPKQAKPGDIVSPRELIDYQRGTM